MAPSSYRVESWAVMVMRVVWSTVVTLLTTEVMEPVLGERTLTLVKEVELRVMVATSLS